MLKEKAQKYFKGLKKYLKDEDGTRQGLLDSVRPSSPNRRPGKDLQLECQ